MRRDGKVLNALICRKFPIRGRGVGPGGSRPLAEDFLWTNSKAR